MARLNARQGRIWSLQNDQEIALKKVWALLLKSFGYPVRLSLQEIEQGDQLCGSALDIRPSERVDLNVSMKLPPCQETPHLPDSHISILSNIRNVYYILQTGGYESNDIFSVYQPDIHELLANYSSEDLHRSLWALGRNDNSDNYLLRFLRISEFNYKFALSWIAQVLEWRHKKYKVEDLLFQGDSLLYFGLRAQRMIDVFRRNEFYIRGTSKSGCPLIFFQATQHKRGRCSDSDFEKVILLYIEWARLGLLEYRRGIDQFHLVINLTGFTMRYADFHGVKFAIKAFQKQFPDSIERLQIHNAPRVFSFMWKILERWMKPHLRERIFFTKKPEELIEYIEPKYIPISLGGLDSYPSVFIEPTTFNCQRRTPDDTFYELIKERDELTIKFIASTIKWIESTTSQESKEYLIQKISLAKDRAINYINLDPYLRTRGVPDRNGEISLISF